MSKKRYVMTAVNMACLEAIDAVGEELDCIAMHQTFHRNATNAILDAEYFGDGAEGEDEGEYVATVFDREARTVVFIADPRREEFF